MLRAENISLIVSERKFTDTCNVLWSCIEIEINESTEHSVVKTYHIKQLE